MKKAKKLTITIFVFILSIIGIFSISIKVNASNSYLEIEPTNVRDNAYAFFLGIPQWSAEYSYDALICNYSVMGNTQTPKSIISVDNNTIYFNFLNGDQYEYDYNSSYYYFYIVDLAQNKEYFGYIYEYDFENDVVSATIQTHNASYTQYNILNFDLLDITQKYYAINASNTTASDFIYTFKINFMQGFVQSNGLQYGYDEYQRGYTNGYYTGLQEGEEGKSPLTRVWEIIGGVFQAVANVMAIELFPSVPVGIFFLVPLVFGAVGFIFWIWKRGG